MTPVSGAVVVRPLDDLRPSPENAELYRPVTTDDPDVVALAESIRRYGVREPLVVSEDGYILSGHRRYVAARLAGLEAVPCRTEPIRRGDADFLRLLREYNRQRIKGHDEQLREEVVAMSPGNAHRDLIVHRRQKKSDLSDCTLAGIDAGGQKRRKELSEAKYEMHNAAVRVLNERREFWPLSVRAIHYALLNDPPLRHTGRPDSRYRNDRASYQDLTDLLARARLTGHVPWEAVTDETRPVTLWSTWPHPQAFMRHELDRFMAGYWRDYMQTQPNHVEIVAEKLTVASILEPVARDYCIPLTIGRGYCSLGPRHDLAERFRQSGRDRLIVLMLSDFDPDGESIAQSFIRSLRDDFRVCDVAAVKVALTGDQVRALDLPPMMTAKRGSATYRQFVRDHGEAVYELEAVPPVELQMMLRAAIETVIDREAFDAEVAAEAEDAVFLAGVRERVSGALRAAP